MPPIGMYAPREINRPCAGQAGAEKLELEAVDDEEEHMLEAEEEGDSLNEMNNLLTPVADLATLRELPKALKKKLGSKEQDLQNITQKYCAGGAGFCRSRSHRR